MPHAWWDCGILIYIGVKGEVQRLQQESSRREFERTSCEDREQQLTAESTQLSADEGILAEVRRKAIRFELAALRNRRANLRQQSKGKQKAHYGWGRDGRRELHVLGSGREASNFGILGSHEAFY